MWHYKYFFIILLGATENELDSNGEEIDVSDEFTLTESDEIGNF